MKKLFILALLVCVGAACAESTVIWQDDFESYDLGPWLGQGNTQVMQSTVNCVGDDPVEGEVEITNDEDNWILHLGRVKTAPGIEQTKMDRGVKLPLDWGDAVYDKGDNAKIRITGKTRIPEGTGYAEIRLVTSEDKPIFRFTPHSSDYKTYFYNHNHNNDLDGSAANSNDVHFVNAAYNRTWYHTTNAVVRDVWCAFEVVIDLDTAQVESYHIKALDDSGFEFFGDRVAHLRYTLERPAFVEFTAVGNGFDAYRTGADFDDLVITYEYEEPEDEWWTLFEDDFQDYELGTSLSDYEIYGRLGDWEQYTDIIETNAFGDKVARLFMGKPETDQRPKDGITLPLPEEMIFEEPGQEIRVTATYYVPDNGCWTMFRSGDVPVATYGFHSANKWFATWGGDDFSPRYDGYERAPYRYYIATRITLGYGEKGPFLKRVDLESSEDTATKWTTEWDKYYDTHLAYFPDNVAIQVQGWPNFDGRYVLLRYLRLEQNAPLPEPAFLAILALISMLFIRKQG